MNDDLQYLYPPDYRLGTGPWGRDKNYMSDLDLRCAVCDSGLTDRHFAAAGPFGANGFLEFK